MSVVEAHAAAFSDPKTSVCDTLLHVDEFSGRLADDLAHHAEFFIVPVEVSFVWRRSGQRSVFSISTSDMRSAVLPPVLWSFAHMT